MLATSTERWTGHVDCGKDMLMVLFMKND